MLVFARLREICGKQQMGIEVPHGATVADCFVDLAERFPELNGLRESTVVAINEEYAEWTDQPADGDTVAFIPPVSGG